MYLTHIQLGYELFCALKAIFIRVVNTNLQNHHLHQHFKRYRATRPHSIFFYTARDFTVKRDELEHMGWIRTYQNQTLYTIQSLILTCSYTLRLFRLTWFHGTAILFVWSKESIRKNKSKNLSTNPGQYTICKAYLRKSNFITFSSFIHSSILSKNNHDKFIFYPHWRCNMN